MSKLFIVGLGPGDPRYMTGQAREAVEQADILCGYTVYIDLIRSEYPEKEFYTTPMKKELERCRWALAQSASGRTVAMVCSGDAGVYGMAGPILQLQEEYPGVQVEIIPGVTAALSGAAVLGAPLMHDFCVISLSDLLTPWETIEKRLRCAALGDFCICIYNPRSRNRPDHLRRACEVLLEEKAPETVCGWVRNIGRDNCEHKIVPLGQLGTEDLDMFTTVFIGSSATKELGGAMVTPRGYKDT